MNLEEWRARIDSLRPRDAGLVHETMRDIAEAIIPDRMLGSVTR